ncbi:hypothetical protein [Paenibacillus sp. 2TAB19]|uniref:hypothetical protein n=1 Tax=Paenibacillus sp. 2TAB19 TaxID=3233003 RepID=UPI003F9C5986
MSEMQVSNITGSVPLESLIGHEVKVKIIKGILPLAKGTTRDYTEFVLAVEPNQDQSDFRVYIRLISSGNTRRMVSGYSRFLSQIQISLVADGDMIDVHHSEVQALMKTLSGL